MFRRLDNYILQRYPIIWETRLHVFLPLGLGIALILFLCPVLSGWSLKDELPSNTVSIYVMVAVALIYLVCWFVSQSRNGTLKTFRNQSLLSTYFHFLNYFLIFFTAFLMIIAIPLGNYQKVRNAINEEELKQDLENLNLGYIPANHPDLLTIDYKGVVRYTAEDFTGNFYNTYSSTHLEPIAISLDETNQIISDYIISFNKYTADTIDRMFYEMPKHNAKPTDFTYLPEPTGIIDTVNTGEYRMTSHICDRRPFSPYFYRDYNYGFEYDISKKISWMLTCTSIGWYFEFMFPWFWKLIFLGIISLTLLTWIFKNVRPHQFILGIIAICLTPVLFNIVDEFVFRALRISGDVERLIFFGIILTLYLLYALLIGMSYFKSRFRSFAGILSIQLQFFLPLFPIFVWGFFIFDRENDFDGEFTANFLYWFAVFICIISIAIFKPIYAKFRSLPSKS